MKSDLKKLFPRIYRDVLEIDELITAGDFQFSELLTHIEDAHNNQFVMKSDERGIEMFEHIYDIKANSTIESLEFRKQRVLLRMRTWPPFSIRWLRGQLDIIIGAGKYDCWVNHGEYSLYIEAITEDSNWYQEVYIFVNEIKPANIIYNFTPKLSADMLANETIGRYQAKWNYKLNGSWLLGEKSFGTDVVEDIWNYKLDATWKIGDKPYKTWAEMEVIKLAVTPSLTPAFFVKHAEVTAEEITKVVVSGTYKNSSRVVNDVLIDITDFMEKVNIANETHLRYALPPDINIDFISNVKLIGKLDLILSSAPIFTPTTPGMQLKHVIRHEEGINYGG